MLSRRRYMPSLQRYGHLVIKAVFGLRVTGVEKVPRTGGLLMASNHISELDPPVLGSCIPRIVHFMAKSELFRGRAATWFFARINAFPVDRKRIDRASLRTAESILLSQGALLMFPEGTRSHDGRALRPKPGIGMLVQRTGVPVLPIFIHGTDRPLGAVLRRPRFSVSLGDPIAPEEMTDAAGDGGFASIAELIMERILETGAKAGLAAEAERSAN